MCVICDMIAAGMMAEASTATAVRSTEALMPDQAATPTLAGAAPHEPAAIATAVTPDQATLQTSDAFAAQDLTANLAPNQTAPPALAAAATHELVAGAAGESAAGVQESATRVLFDQATQEISAVAATAPDLATAGTMQASATAASAAKPATPLAPKQEGADVAVISGSVAQHSGNDGASVGLGESIEPVGGEVHASLGATGAISSYDTSLAFSSIMPLLILAHFVLSRLQCTCEVLEYCLQQFRIGMKFRA